ncbi:hypothetical protein CBER1_11062 [Cercospora berteroae]|uniref:tripeptidyl-peptidase II n=1 Tax=Cercospora berteroae TaxID=357750 RepID=A0A2S6BYJ1_9PEZI|nr:hypothetical protein CBER1_11062 [Cercospora berteroae]
MLFHESIFTLGIIAAVGAFSSNTRNDYAVKERHFLPQGWTRISAARKLETIHLKIGLKQQSGTFIEQHLLQVSDPSHERYGQHLTAAEIEEIVRPPRETLDLVTRWLEEHTIHGVYNSATNIIHAVISIQKVEDLLQTSYSVFQHTDGTSLTRALEWSLPQYLHEHIDLVQPTNAFFRAQSRNIGVVLSDASSRTNEGKALLTPPPLFNGSNVSLGIVCNASFVTPDCKRRLYGTYDYVPQVPGKNRIGQPNFLNQTSYRKDIEKGLKQFRPEAAPAAYTFKSTSIAGGVDAQGPYTHEQVLNHGNVEAILDSTNIISIAWPTPLEVWNTGGSVPFVPDERTPTNTNEPYLVWLDYILSQDSLPQVISTSYSDDEQTVPRSYATRVCTMFAQLGARGVSMLFSSGDNGVGPDGNCTTNDGKNTSQFLPSFPTSCPWITSVGATAEIQPEVAVKSFASGAGFSNYFTQPMYQADTVDGYIASLNGLHDGKYNKSGRAYPDVAAQGMLPLISSAPTFAAVISLVNDALLADDKPPLGFLNPWLYSGAYKALTDITSGSSHGCNTTGFPAQAGWDAVTGWGTPNFRKLLNAAFERYRKDPHTNATGDY